MVTFKAMTHQCGKSVFEVVVGRLGIHCRSGVEVCSYDTPVWEVSDSGSCCQNVQEGVVSIAAITYQNGSVGAEILLSEWIREWRLSKLGHQTYEVYV